MAHLTRERLEREHHVRVIDLADATGYSPSYISLILSGKREAPLHVRSAIARALGARVKDLWPSQSETANA
jgi:transcriptional regulator with XRE-family HTH domain